jgi:NADPH:quinone reductase-like Zn-dependent oxidoreductase
VRRIQYHRYGGPDVLRLEEVQPEVPGRGQVLVRVRAAAANAIDWKIRSGQLRLATGKRFPRGVGHDFAGVVEAVGVGVNRLQVGDSVLGATGARRPGAFADLVVADESAIVLKPDALTFEQAATLPIIGVTAYQAVGDASRLRPGQAVFINGCLGGVGRAAVQLARRRGAVVAGSCRPEFAKLAADLGVDPVVGFDVDPTPLAGRFDLVLDTAGTLPISTARALLAPHGRILDLVPTLPKFVRGVLPGPYSLFVGRPITSDLQAVVDAAGRGDLRVPVARTVRLEEAIPALAELETEGRPKNGKLVVVPA